MVMGGMAEEVTIILTDHTTTLAIQEEHITAIQPITITAQVAMLA